MIEYIHDKRLNSATLRIDVNISISVSVLVYYRCTASCCQQQQVAACAVQSVTLLRVLYWAVLSQSVLQGSSHTLIYPPAPIRIQSTEHFYKPPVVMLIYPQYICTAVTILVPPSQSNDIAKKSAFKPKRGHESTTGIHLIDE